VDDSHLAALRRLAVDFRAAIEAARADRLPSALPYFPEGACRMTSRLFARYLTRLPGATFSAPQLVSGVLPGSEPPARHFWLEVDGTVVDLTADPFGEPAVVVGSRTAFHQSLTSLVSENAAQAIGKLSTDEAARLARQLAAIESRLRGSHSSIA
jgi:hypothetical protein